MWWQSDGQSMSVERAFTTEELDVSAGLVTNGARYVYPQHGKWSHCVCLAMSLLLDQYPFVITVGRHKQHGRVVAFHRRCLVDDLAVGATHLDGIVVSAT